MNRIIEVKVNGDYLIKDSDQAGTQYEANVNSLRITFDESWDGFAKKVLFWDAAGKNPVRRILTVDMLENVKENTRVYLCPIPGEPMAVAGKCEFVIEGYVDGKRQRTVADKLKVKPSPASETETEPADPTPSQAEQIQAQMESVLGNIQRAILAADVADAAMERAESAQNAADEAIREAGIAQEMMETGTHAARHAAGGEDQLTPEMIGAATIAQVTAAQSAAGAAQVAADNAQIAANNAQGAASIAQARADSAALKQTVVGDGYDLNGVLSSGFYRLASAHPNMPAGCDYGQMLVIQGGGDTITQICISYSNIAYMRSGNALSPSGGWSGWREIEFADKTVKKTGDTMTGRLQVPALTATDYGSPVEGSQYYDFHAVGSTTDYSGRFTVDASNTLYYSKYGEPNNRVIHEGLITKSTADIGEGAWMAPGSFYIVYQ